MAVGNPTKGTLVEFVQDCAPYCKGDVVRLDKEAQDYVAKRVKKQKIEGTVYNEVKAKAAKTE